MNSVEQPEEELREMRDEETRLNGVCRGCGSNEAVAAADARALGFLDEFLAGTYTCCQVVQWADEQWAAWQEAAQEDGKAPEEVTRPLEIEPDALLIPVRKLFGRGHRNRPSD